jgi:hypothetical protein
LVETIDHFDELVVSLPVVAENREADCFALRVDVWVEDSLLAFHNWSFIGVLLRYVIDESDFAIFVEPVLWSNDDMEGVEGFLIWKLEVNIS